MRSKIIILVIGILTLTVSCSKDKNVEPSQELYKVAFTPSGFSRVISPLKSTVVESAQRHYMLFDGENNYVKDITFDSSEQIEDNLLVGSYTAFITASDSENSSVYISGYGNSIGNAYFSVNPSNGIADAYAGKVEFTVGETHEVNRRGNPVQPNVG